MHSWEYWCTTPVTGSFFWRFFASQKSNNNRIEKADRNDLRLTLALRMAPVPLKTTGQNLTSIILSAKKNFRLQASCTNSIPTIVSHEGLEGRGLGLSSKHLASYPWIP